MCNEVRVVCGTFYGFLNSSTVITPVWSIQRSIIAEIPVDLSLSQNIASAPELMDPFKVSQISQSSFDSGSAASFDSDRSVTSPLESHEWSGEGIRFLYDRQTAAC